MGLSPVTVIEAELSAVPVAYACPSVNLYRYRAGFSDLVLSCTYSSIPRCGFTYYCTYAKVRRCLSNM